MRRALFFMVEYFFRGANVSFRGIDTAPADGYPW